MGDHAATALSRDPTSCSNPKRTVNELFPTAGRGNGPIGRG